MAVLQCDATEASQKPPSGCFDVTPAQGGAGRMGWHTDQLTTPSSHPADSVNALNVFLQPVAPRRQFSYHTPSLTFTGFMNSQTGHVLEHLCV